MEDLRELYQQVILDHNKNPKNFLKLEKANHTAEGYNPLCGDRVNVYLQVEDDVIKDISFQGSGCAISKASASVMTTEIKGKTVAEAKEIFNTFQALVTNNEVEIDEFSKLAVFSGVRDYPVRIKCAVLAWHALHSALTESDEPVAA